MKKKQKIIENDVYIPAKSMFYDKDFESQEPYKWQSWGLVIKNIRDHTGMDQLVFGRLLQGYTRMQISRYETESAEPPIDFLIKLAKFFGLNLNWAFSGHGLPYIQEFQDCPERKRFMDWIRLIAEKENFLKDLQGF